MVVRLGRNGEGVLAGLVVARDGGGCGVGLVRSGRSGLRGDGSAGRGQHRHQDALAHVRCGGESLDAPASPAHRAGLGRAARALADGPVDGRRGLGIGDPKAPVAHGGEVVAGVGVLCGPVAAGGLRTGKCEQGAHQRVTRPRVLGVARHALVVGEQQGPALVVVQLGDRALGRVEEPQVGRGQVGEQRRGGGGGGGPAVRAEAFGAGGPSGPAHPTLQRSRRGWAFPELGEDRQEHLFDLGRVGHESAGHGVRRRDQPVVGLGQRQRLAAADRVEEVGLGRPPVVSCVCHQVTTVEPRGRYAEQPARSSGRGPGALLAGP